MDALNIYENLNDYAGSAQVQLMLQGVYREARDYQKALAHALTGYRQIIETNINAKATIGFPGHRLVPIFLAEIAQTYVLNNQTDSALIYAQKAINENELFEGAKWNFPIYLLAVIETIQGNYGSALQNYRLAVPLAMRNGFYRDTLQIYSGLSTLFRKMGKLDSAIYYAQKLLQLQKTLNWR